MPRFRFDSVSHRHKYLIELIPRGSSRMRQDQSSIKITAPFGHGSERHILLRDRLVSAAETRQPRGLVPCNPAQPEAPLLKDLPERDREYLHVVGFLPFLAEYFSRQVFRPMFTGLRKELVNPSNFCKTKPNRDSHGAARQCSRMPVWFQLRGVRETVRYPPGLLCHSLIVVALRYRALIKHRSIRPRQCACPLA